MDAFGEMLDELIRRVRRRWLITRGVTLGALLLSGLVIFMLVAIAVAHSFQYHPLVVMLIRATAVLGLLLGVGVGVYGYVRRAPDRERIARLIEEKSGGLHDRLVTAVEVIGGRAPGVPSGVITERLVADAARLSATIRPEMIIPRQTLLRRSVAAVLPPLLLTLIVTFDHGTLRSGAIRLFAPWLTNVMPAMAIVVTPGDVTVARGLDQLITASLQGFDSESATISFRRVGDSSWREEPMERPSTGPFRFLFFNLRDSVEYYVTARHVRSPSFTIHVRDLPTVTRLTLIYTYPRYTRLGSKTVEEGGDIVALRGTVVTVIAHLSGSARSARIVLADGQAISMTPAGEDRFSGQITIQKNSSYRIELTPPAGTSYPGSSEYLITALEDEPPMVVLEKPGRDLKVTALQEVFAEARAEDDTGIGKLELYYSVNGGPEQRVTLYEARGAAPRTISGAHTFFLEEFQLQPGDVISYYARAEDNNRATGPGVATTDIYFLEVRPLDRRFRQAQQAPGMQGGEQDAGAFSERQKEIIAATWRVVQQKDRWSPTEFTENMNAIELGQSTLRADVQGLIERIRRRLGAALDEQAEFKALVENLEAATEAMTPAIEELRQRRPRSALPHEQKAYQHLLRADAVFREIQVAFGTPGDREGSRAQDLADLFELELDKMKNQYETVQRDRGQQRQRELDETIRRLRELAERQQRVAEQQMRQGMPASSSGRTAAQSQQQLSEELRSLARQLERLSREQNEPRLNEIARQLAQATREMDQARASGNPTQALAEALRALERLDAARRQLQGTSREHLERDLSRLREQAAELRRKQQEIVREVDRLARRSRTGADSGSNDERQVLQERKDLLAQQVGRLGQDVEQTARAAARENPTTAEKLREAGEIIRRERLPEQIEQSNRLLQNQWYEYARERERQIQRALDEVAERVEAAGRRLGQDRAGESLERALDRTKRLGDSLEALERRLRERSPSSGQPGSAPSQSQRPQQAEGSGRETASSPQSQQQGRSGDPSGARQAPGERTPADPSGSRPAPRQGRRTADALSNPIGRSGPAEDSSADATSGVRPRNTALPRDADALRQLDRELGERLGEAEDIRRLLRREPTLADDMAGIIARLRQLDEATLFHDPRQLDLLRAAIIEPLRRIEFELSRKLQDKLGQNALRLGDDLSVPERYRALVEDYYKRLSRRPKP